MIDLRGMNEQAKTESIYKVLLSLYERKNSLQEKAREIFKSVEEIDEDIKAALNFYGMQESMKDGTFDFSKMVGKGVKKKKASKKRDYVG